MLDFLLIAARRINCLNLVAMAFLCYNYGIWNCSDYDVSLTLNCLDHFYIWAWELGTKEPNLMFLGISLIISYGTSI